MLKEQEIRIALAGKLQRFRKRAGLTTAEVGSKVGKSDKTVSGWEHGRGQPDADTLFQLCELYGIKNIAEFFTDDVASVMSSLSDREEKLLSAFQQLNEEGQDKIIDYIDDLVQSGKYNKTDTTFMDKEA